MVFNIGSLELVQAVEHNASNQKIKKILIRTLPKKILKQADVLILGCTHFPLIKKQIKSYVDKNIDIVDSGKAVAKRVADILKRDKLLNMEDNPSIIFFTTGKTEFIRKIKFKPIQS